ncbi:hypothetical protein [Bacillus wiedmannii]|nr:hypothetical protein [Bacillus wiedmannii]MEE3949698.1 hypothetical protein [Bacillus wiedmannii]HDR7354271.1 hypothetical protein [Bacillus wiedmannii]HDR7676805.1 hypothetical protein [Bacillus wiedmannii]
MFFKTLRRWILQRLNLCEVTNALAHVIFLENTGIFENEHYKTNYSVPVH